MARTSSITPAVLSLALALVVAPSLAAQTYTLRVRSDTSELAERQQRRLQRELDSLTQVYYENDDLSVAERRRVAEALERTVARMGGGTARGATVTVRATPAPMASMMNARAFSEMSHTLMQLQASQAAMPKGWIGIVAEGPGEEPRVQNGQLIIRYLSYPRIVSVDPSSPAQRAGLVPSDTLLAYDGRDLRDNDISLTQLLRPNARISVRVLRDGRVREVPVTVAPVPSRVVLRRDNEINEVRAPLAVAGAWDAPSFPRSPAAPAPMASGGASARRVTLRSAAAPPAPMMPMAPMSAAAPAFSFSMGSANGVAGAQLMSITEGLGRTLGIRNGVLVTSAPVGTPANESGLADGDVILKVEGQIVHTVPQLRAIVAQAAGNGERSVELETMRERRTRRVVLRW